MSMVRPREIAFRGSVGASGVLISPSILGELRATERILRLWEPGSQVWSVGGQLFVRFVRVIAMRSESAPGLPAVAMGQAFTTVPLSAKEWEQLQPSANALVLVHDGIARADELRASAAVDPAVWVDTRSFAIVSPEGLGAPVPPPLVAQAQPIELRKLLPGVPVESSEAKQVRQSLRERKPAHAAQMGLLAKLRQMFASKPRATQRGSARPSDAQRTRQTAAPGTAKPGPWLRFLQRIMWKSPFARWLSDRYARYLAQLLHMFSEGDLDAALRHAIPLSEAQRLDVPSSLLPSLTPRNSLSIQPEQKPGGSSVGLGVELFETLRRLYREAFERLSAQQRVEEAAFVLAELLEAHEEAVAFLEAHGRLRLAAELAEGRHLKPELVVRQWIIAGDIARAVRTARRHQAFPAAVALLERAGKKDEAMRMRELWAESLANDGNFAGAVDVMWPKVNEVAKVWMRQCIRLGGTAGGRMLARWAMMLPNEFDEFREAAISGCEEDSDDGARFRVGLANELAGFKPDPVAASVARLAARAQIRDISAGRPAIPQPRLAALVETTGDRCLRWDRPTDQRKPPMPLRDRTQPITYRFEAHDSGASELEDAVLLPNGQILAAFGERGAALLNGNGRIAASFTEPSYRLAISAAGTRAVALARRGNVWRLARIDLALRRAEHWREASFSAWASDYANGLWYVGDQHNAYAIDTQAPDFDALWSLTDVGTVHAIARSFTDLWILTGTESLELWRYELPSHTLRRRDRIPHPMSRVGGPKHSQAWTYSLSESGRLFALLMLNARNGMTYQYRNGDWHTAGHDERTPIEKCELPVLRDGYTFIQEHDASGISVLTSLDSGRLALRCRFEGASRVSVFAFNQAVTLTDNRGRLVSIEMETGALARNLRL